MRLLYQPFEQKRRPPLMKFYCGIDLSARDCHVCVIDEQLKIVVQQKLRNELAKICQLLAPYKANLKIVVESTFNWYWLIDGLQAEGFDVVLADTLLLQLPGVGQTIALTILYEVGELTRFANVKVFSSYCRVVPGIAQSGNVSRRGRASKQGNHYLKAAFSQAAVHAVRCYPKVRRYYERQLQRHRGRGRQMICYNIIAHKLAQAAFHVLKEQTEYREELLFGR